jgi:uncharacterized membrane protein (DUF2068 family)
MPKQSARPLGIFLVALFKLFKGLLLLALAIGALKLLDRDVSELFSSLVVRLHLDLENHFIQSILASLDLVDNRMLGEISAATFGFAGLLFVEGLGLLFQQRWAEYVTVFETAFFIPIELFEIVRRVTITRASVLVVNCAVVTYLLWTLIRKPRKKEVV